MLRVEAAIPFSVVRAEYADAYLVLMVLLIVFAALAGYHLLPAVRGDLLILAEGEGAKLTPATIDAAIGAIRKDVHQVQPQAVSVTQASEYGRCYRPEEMAAIAAAAQGHGLALHVDGARFANAVAFLGCSPWEACAGASALSFGCVKNGGMSAEALVFFDQGLADVARLRRKRAGHLQSKGRFLAAQVLAMVEDGLWLDNARAANAAAQELAGAAAERLLHPVEANELFLTCTATERAALRTQGFSFYDWGDNAARLVTAWNSDPAHVAALARVTRPRSPGTADGRRRVDRHEGRLCGGGGAHASRCNALLG